MKKIAHKLKILFVPCEENQFKSRILQDKFLLRYIVLLFILKLIALSLVIYLPKTALFADVSKVALISLTNSERQEQGISPLNQSPELEEAAYRKGLDMLASDYFAHYSPDGVSPWYWMKEAGYNYKSAGENLAIGFLDSEEVVDAWINSESHKKNLLNPKFEEMGIAVITGNFNGRETTVVVQHFGASQEGEPKGEGEMTQDEIVTGASQGVKGTYFSSYQGDYSGDIGSLLFLKFATVDYQYILEGIIFYSLILVVIFLLINIFVKINIQDGKLILKTSIFIILLILFSLSSKEAVIELIPHNLMIY